MIIIVINCRWPVYCHTSGKKDYISHKHTEVIDTIQWSVILWKELPTFFQVN